MIIPAFQLGKFSAGPWQRLHYHYLVDCRTSNLILYSTKSSTATDSKNNPLQSYLRTPHSHSGTLVIVLRRSVANVYLKASPNSRTRPISSRKYIFSSKRRNSCSCTQRISTPCQFDSYQRDQKFPKKYYSKIEWERVICLRQPERGRLPYYPNKIFLSDKLIHTPEGSALRGRLNRIKVITKFQNKISHKN